MLLNSVDGVDEFPPGKEPGVQAWGRRFEQPNTILEVLLVNTALVGISRY